MPAQSPIGPTFRGVFVKDYPGGFGLLRESTSLRDRPAMLCERMEEAGYLYLPGLLDRDQVLNARGSVLNRLAAEGLLDPGPPVDEAVARPGAEIQFRPDLANGNPQVESLLYTGAMMSFWEDFLGGKVRHFDYTWLRAKGPGSDTVTNPHCDTVFMGRGTSNLYTAWTPLGPVPYDLGGLMILEGSHRAEAQLAEYWKMDVDDYCTNGPEAAAIESGEKRWQGDKQEGFFRPDAEDAQQLLGGRWLSTEYQPGDLLVFKVHTLHAAADNRTRSIRLSTDSRYQPADEPADERWVGPHPVGHGPGGKQGKIC